MNKHDETDYWVMRIPVISTAHLTESVAREFAETLPGDDFYGFYCAVTPHGGFVATSGWDVDIPNYEVPRCLKDTLAWAEGEGFEWVRFDADGDQIDELPIYEWENDE